jgi:hypothetical protein
VSYLKSVVFLRVAQKSQKIVQFSFCRFFFFTEMCLTLRVMRGNWPEMKRAVIAAIVAVVAFISQSAIASQGRRMFICLHAIGLPPSRLSANAGRILALGPNEAPNFIAFDLSARKAFHLLVLDYSARFANADAKAHNRVAVDASDALNGADAASLAKHGDCHYFVLCG